MTNLDKKFVHIGSDLLTYEEFTPVYNGVSFNSNKPSGGLWLSEMANQSYCDWFRFIENPSKLFELYKQIPTKGCIVKLKEKAKIMYIRTKEELQQAYLKYPLTSELFYLDFQKIACENDALYVEPNVDKSLKEWNVKTLLVFNPKTIESYQPINIEYQWITDGCSFEEYAFKISEIKESKNLVQPSNDYFLLEEIVKKFYDNYCAGSDFSTITNDNIELMNGLVEIILKQIGNNYSKRIIINIILRYSIGEKHKVLTKKPHLKKGDNNETR